MTLREYISELEDLERSLPDIINEFVKKRATYLVGNVKMRFYNYGIDGRGNFLGHYAERTAERKKKAGQRVSHVTLLDTGAWWDSLFAVYEDGELMLQSSMPDLTQKLIDGEGFWFTGYGEGILEFTDHEIESTGIEIERDLAEYLQSKFNTDINLTI